MFRNVKKGWYLVKNPEKIIPPTDTYMKSFNESEDGIRLNYKSSLELKGMQYADDNISVEKWSIEPFHIKYIKPTDGKYHRYFIDMFLVIKNKKFLVEIKPDSQTKMPKMPKKQTPKSIRNYKRALQTFDINQAKWKAATEFAAANHMKFIILTEKHLNMN